MSAFAIFNLVASVIAGLIVLIFYGPVIVESWQDFVYSGKKIKEEPADDLLF